MKFSMLDLVVVAASAMAAAVKAQPVIESRPLRAVLLKRQLSKPRIRQSLHRNFRRRLAQWLCAYGPRTLAPHLPSSPPSHALIAVAGSANKKGPGWRRGLLV